MKYLDVPSSGSIADRTHSHNRAGQYVRNRRAPVQPIGTGRRAFMRAAFGSASQAWGAATPAERASWDAAADSHPVTDSLGQSIKLTGHQLYVAVNSQLLNLELAMSDTVPPDFSVFALAGVALTADSSPSTLTVTWTAAAAADYVLIAFSPPLPPGRSFTNTFWQLQSDTADSGSVVGATGYVAEFGALTAGTRIFCKVTPVNQYGVTGVPVIISGLVTA
jgi:hypothetical protein